MAHGTVGVIVIVFTSIFCLTSCHDIVKVNFPEHPKDPEHDGKKDEVCDNLNYTKQCFQIIYPFFDPLFRPVSVLPDMNTTTRFLLYTRKNPKNPDNFLLDKDHLKHSNYASGKQVTVLVHGYGTNYSSLASIRDELLAYDDRNIFLIDWKEAANVEYYQAVANARLVAHRVLNMLLFLMKNADLKPRDIYLIGASVGGQLVAYVGKNIKNLGRITGLDPAGPYFVNTRENVRLNRNDADFVDTIRTNAGFSIYQGMGYLGPVGHADFYVNGGNHQPQCDNKPFVKKKVQGKYFSNECSHLAAVQYFASSISKCQYKATTCVPFEGFDNGNCKNKPTNRMGFFAKKPENQTSYFLNTEKTPPYCGVKK